MTARVSANLTAAAADISSTLSQWAKLSDVVSLSGVAPEDWDVTVEVRTTIDDPAGTLDPGLSLALGRIGMVVLVDRVDLDLFVLDQRRLQPLGVVRLARGGEVEQ